MRSKFEGKTYEEALQKCLRTLECDETEIYIEQKETGSGLLKPAKVVIEVLPKSEVVEYIKEIIRNIGNAVVSRIDVKVKDIDDVLNISISSEINSVLIGKDGKNLSAIQTIIKQAVSKKFDQNIKLTVDIANYKTNRIKSMTYEVKRIAEEVLKTKVDAKLDPMNSYERRIIHTLISEYKNLETMSEGEAPNRYVVIKYKEDE